MEDLVDAKVEKYIAHGVSASVYKARWNNMDCAIKKFKIVKGNGHVVTSPRPKAHPAGSGEAGAGGTDETIDGDAGDTKNEGLEGFRNEVFLLKKLQHENLIAVYAVCDRPQSQLFALVMELMVIHLSDLVPLEIVLHSFSSLVSVIIILPCWSWCSLALSLSFSPTATHVMRVGTCSWQVGSIDELLHGRRSRSLVITEKTAVAILRGITTGMSFLHKHGVAHRDLKSPNVL